MKTLLLAAPDDVKDTLSLTASSYSVDDPRFVEGLAIASSMIEEYTGRKFLYAARTEYLDIPKINGPWALNLLGIPINPVGITAKYSPYSDWTVDPLTEAMGYLSNPETGRFYVDMRTENPARRSLKVTYEGGLVLRATPFPNGIDNTKYDLVDAPIDLKRATAIQAGAIMNAMLQNSSTSYRESNQRQAAPIPAVKGIVPEARALLAKYKRSMYTGY